MNSPEAEDLVDALVGAATIARKARTLVESAAASAPDEALPAPDAELVLVMLGVVAMAQRLETALASWEPEPEPSFETSSAPAASMRDLLR